MIQEEGSGTSFGLTASGKGGGLLSTFLFVGDGPMATGQHARGEGRPPPLLEPRGTNVCGFPGLWLEGACI